MNASKHSTKTHQDTDKRSHYQGLGDLFLVRRDLNVLRKVLYIGTVFLGLVLAWYGVWTLVAATWPFSHPAVATVLGVLLLLVTGKIKDLD